MAAAGRRKAGRGALGLKAVLLLALADPCRALTREQLERLERVGPEHQWANKDRFKKNGVHFIKIQKTGGTSLSMMIEEVCGKNSDDCWSSSHIDWAQATANGSYPGRTVTVLRDPVERTLSEFFFMRDTDGIISASQAQWDFRNNSWLHKVQKDMNIDRAFDTYINGYPKNPSRNRQALYILGFRDPKTWPPDDRKHRVPGEVYDWDKDKGRLVKLAMDRLESLTAYGFTECWEPTLRVFARELHWPMHKVQRMVPDTHARNWRSDMVRRDKPDAKLLEVLTGKELSPDGLWRDIVPKRWVRMIQSWSNVDLLLNRRAKQRFYERFRESCL